MKDKEPENSSLLANNFSVAAFSLYAIGGLLGLSGIDSTAALVLLGIGFTCTVLSMYNYYKR